MTCCGSCRNMMRSWRGARMAMWARLAVETARTSRREGEMLREVPCRLQLLMELGSPAGGPRLLNELRHSEVRPDRSRPILKSTMAAIVTLSRGPMAAGKATGLTLTGRTRKRLGHSSTNVTSCGLMASVEGASPATTPGPLLILVNRTT